MSPLELLEKNSAVGNIKQSIASSNSVEESLVLVADRTARERDNEEQFEASMYYRNSSNQYNYDYYYQLNLNAIPQEQVATETEQPTAKYKRGVQFRTKFWTVLSMVALLPLFNSALYNAYALSKNIAQQVVLGNKLKAVVAEKQDLETKLKEFSSDSGLKRAIKQEMNLVESNEIVVKIVQD